MPDERWREAFETYARDHALPGVDAAAAAYAQAPGDDTLRALTLASADWNFTPAGLAQGRALPAHMPYCHEAVAWADAHFDARYQARWTPERLPTLLLSGAVARDMDPDALLQHLRRGTARLQRLDALVDRPLTLFE